MAHPKSKKAKQAKAARKAAKTTPEDTKQKEDALQRRAERQAQEKKTKAQQVRTNKLKTYGSMVGILVVVVGGIFFIINSRPEIDGVEKPNNDGRGHIVGATYDSAAPTSGEHRAQSPSCGTYTSPLDLDLAVHALEHGVVVLWHDPAQPNLGAELQAIASRWDSHVIVSPNPGIDSPVVATAWNRRMRYDPVSEDVAEFIDVYRRRGPERVDCDF